MVLLNKITDIKQWAKHLCALLHNTQQRIYDEMCGECFSRRICFVYYKFDNIQNASHRCQIESGFCHGPANFECVVNCNSILYYSPPPISTILDEKCFRL